MFLREKKSGNHVYLQIVENRWRNGQARQRVIATLGRLDRLQESGQLEALLQSGARFCQSLMVLSSHKKGELPQVDNRRIGPVLIFERLWQQTGCQQVLNSLLCDRKFEFPVERAIFLEVLHRLLEPGSDRAGYQWKQAYNLPGTESLMLHHAYRAMAWLGEVLPAGQQQHRTPFSPRCVKDLIEERLFEPRRHLFSSLDVVFFDTTSIYFEGKGGESLGQRGKSKDRRPDCPQIVVGVVLDDDGYPICCEMWPGNTSDVTTLLPVVDRLRQRFGIQRVCVVADRGMISGKNMKALESDKREWLYILGARLRNSKEVHGEVLSRAGRYREVHPPRGRAKDPSPLKVKEVWVEDRRYIVCLNEAQKRKDAADREAIVSALRSQLRQGDKSLIGNRGYRKYIKTQDSHFEIDEKKMADEARLDGKWVLRTNTDLSAEEVALKYKELWMVESLFRSVKSLLATRPVFHKCDVTIRGHVFCSFLALLLRQQLQERLESWGASEVEWADVIRDLDRLEEIEVIQQGKHFLLRTDTAGVAGKVFQAVGVALPPTVRQLEEAR